MYGTVGTLPGRWENKAIYYAYFVLHCSIFSQAHYWVTKNGAMPLLPSEEENCGYIVEVTEEEVANSVKIMPKLETLVSLFSSYASAQIIRNYLDIYKWDVEMKIIFTLGK